MTGNYSKIPKYFTTKKVHKGIKVANEELSDEPDCEADFSEDHDDQPKPTRRGKKRQEKYRRYKLYFVYGGRSEVKLPQQVV